MKTKPALFTLLALLLCAPVTHAAERAMGGHTEGNGGDGVYRDGNLVLRDFIATAKVDAVPDSKKYLEQFPELPQLIRDVALGNPAFAMSVWSDLVHAHIWLTDAELPLLPAAVTSVIAGKADVQIAIRYGEDIVISRPALAQVQNKEYVFLHEALHGLMRDDNSPWHHEKVRSLVRYVKENRGKYDAVTFAAVLEKFGLTYSVVDDENSAAMRQLALAMIFEQGDAKARCALLNLGDENIEDEIYFPDLRGNGMESLWSWGSYNRCQKEKRRDVFVARYPEAKNWLKYRDDAIIAFVYKVTMPKNVGLLEFGFSRVILEQCQKYGQPAALVPVAQAEQKIKRMEKILQQLRADLAAERDLAVAYILKTYLTNLEGEWGVKKAKEHLQLQRANYRYTVSACRENFGDYLNR